MASTSFTNGVSLTDADWFDDVDRVVYDILGDPADAAAAYTAIKQAASDTATGAIEIATQAEQETGTDVVRAVTPGRQHFHPSAAKAWVEVGLSGNVSTAYNVTSVTDGGTGIITVNFATAFSSASYCAVGTVGGGSTAARVFVTNVFGTGSFIGNCLDGAGGLQDPAGPSVWTVAFFGDQ